jgi:hypothetical protein
VRALIQAQRVEEDVRLKLMRAKLDIETRQAQEAKSHRSIDEVYDSLHVPYDLRFPDMKQFIEHNIKRATQDLVPRCADALISACVGRLLKTQLTQRPLLLRMECFVRMEADHIIMLCFLALLLRFQEKVGRTA